MPDVDMSPDTSVLAPISDQGHAPASLLASSAGREHFSHSFIDKVHEVHCMGSGPWSTPTAFIAPVLDCAVKDRLIESCPAFSALNACLALAGAVHLCRVIGYLAPLQEVQRTLSCLPRGF